MSNQAVAFDRRIEALIFDVDGTLAETEELHRQAFNETFAEAGLPWHWDTALYASLLEVTGGKERMRHFQSAFPDRAGPASPDIASLHAAKTNHYTALVASGRLQLRPGIARLLREAKANNLKLAIATTTSRPNVDALLAATLGPDAAHMFQIIAAGDEVPAKKPAPDIYHLALARLALPAAACVAVEDTPNGLRAARGAGLRTIVTLSAYGGTGPFDGALAVVNNLGEPAAPAQILSGPATGSAVIGLQQIEHWCTGNR